MRYTDYRRLLIGLVGSIGIMAITGAAQFINHVKFADIADSAAVAGSANLSTALLKQLRNAYPDTLRGVVPMVRGIGGVTNATESWYSIGGGGYQFHATTDDRITTSVILPYSIAGRTTIAFKFMLIGESASTSGQEWDIEVGGGGCGTAEAWNVESATASRSFQQAPTTAGYPLQVTKTFTTSNFGLDTNSIGFNIYLKRYGTTTTGGTGNNGDDSASHAILVGEPTYAIY